MSENDEPTLEITHSLPSIGEPPTYPMLSAERGGELETIWQVQTMVTPTTGTNSQSLKNYWREFVARFRSALRVAFGCLTGIDGDLHHPRGKLH